MFAGGLFHASLPGGRMGAELALQGDGLQAVTADGQTFRLPFSEAVLERGGADHRMVFFRTADRSLTMFTEDLGLLTALEETGDPRMVEAAAAIRASTRQRRQGRLRNWVIGATVLAALIVGVPPLFSALVDAAVHALPWSVDRQIGKLATATGEGVKLDAPEIEAAVDAIVERLASSEALEPYTEIEFTVRVVADDTVNAYALPGGFITVNRGLLVRAERPEEVAGVIAHEMAHVTERHGLERIAQSIGVYAALQLLLGNPEGMLELAAELFAAGTILSYSRSQESEADLVGLDVLRGAQVDPRGMAEFFERMQRIEAEAGVDVPDWLSSHPDTRERKRTVARSIATTDTATRAIALEVDWAALKTKLQEE